MCMYIYINVCMYTYIYINIYTLYINVCIYITCIFTYRYNYMCACAYALQQHIPASVCALVIINTFPQQSDPGRDTTSAQRERGKNAGTHRQSKQAVNK